MIWGHVGGITAALGRREQCQHGLTSLHSVLLSSVAEQPPPRDYGYLSTFRLLNPFFSFLLFAAGWWLVENADKQIAWFPASYLEEIDIYKDIQNALSSNNEGKSAPDPWTLWSSRKTHRFNQCRELWPSC